MENKKIHAKIVSNSNFKSYMVRLGEHNTNAHYEPNRDDVR